MSLQRFKIFTILLPSLIIGGFEYIRHDFLLRYLSMEAGNFYITVITLALSYVFATWMFRSIDRINHKLTQVEAKRAVYEERERLARELHDNLAQTLFFLNVKLKKGEVEEAKAAVSEIDNHLRQAIFNLRTSPEAGACFSARLHKWLEDWETLSGIELSEEINLTEDGFSPSEEVQLFGIVQEAFTNIRKHSKARHAAILFRADSNEWLLRITDDGQGMQPTERNNKAYGITLMRKRVQELGAAMELHDGSDGGTELTFSAKRGKSD